jgi:hypothetical protein
MLIMFTAGQLGNQIFQYGFIESIKENKEKIITSKCEYFDIFEYEKKNYLFLNKYNRFILRRILNFFSKIRLISSIKQTKEIMNNYTVNSDNFIEKKGLLAFIKIVDGFYQSSKFIKSIPKIKTSYIQDANQYLSDIPEEMQKVFVHIRRGDYLEWSVLGKKNPSLPLSYYKTAITNIQNNLNNPLFIFLSNDTEYVKKEFNYIKNKKISQNCVGLDIAIMQSCENAVVSNSTLSWWGVNLIKNKNIICAPRYWLGWQSKVWYPKDIVLDFVKYFKVEK